MKYSDVDVSSIRASINTMKNKMSLLNDKSIILSDSFNEDDWKVGAKKTLENKLEMVSGKFISIFSDLDTCNLVLDKIEKYQSLNKEIQNKENEIAQIESKVDRFGKLEDTLDNWKINSIRNDINNLKNEQAKLDGEISSINI